MHILADTNAWLYSIRNKVDLIRLSKKEFLKILVPDLVFNELEKISLESEKGKFRKDARLVLDIIEAKNLERVKIERKGSVDNSILRFAVDNECAVLTNDKIFKQKLKKKGVKVYFLRQGRILAGG
jgi:rRNA-processing protein FCF1